MKYLLYFILAVLVVLGLFFVLKSPRHLKFKENITIQSDTANVLQVDVRFKLESPDSASIQYWKKGAESKIYTTPKSFSAEEYSIRLIGLEQKQRYGIKILTHDGNSTVSSDTLGFRTGDIPRGMLKALWIKELQPPFNGFILSQRQRARSSQGFVYATNSEGNTVWYNKVPGTVKISKWSSRGTILVLCGNPKQERSAGNRILEFDVYGKLLSDIDVSLFDTPIEIHHEILPLDNDNFLGLIYDKRTINLSGKKGSSTTQVTGDAIIRFNKKGVIEWRWSVFDALDPAKDQSRIDSVGEWGHANALEIDKDNNYLLSFRDWNQVWKINSTTGEVMWKLGEGGDIKLPDGFEFSGQHAIHINPFGDYMMFDNGTKKNRSNVISFGIDEKTKEAHVKLNIALPAKYYSKKRGSAYFIDNEKILVCAAEAGTLLIMDVNGNILAEARTGLPDYYRANYIPELYPDNH